MPVTFEQPVMAAIFIGTFLYSSNRVSSFIKHGSPSSFDGITLIPVLQNPEKTIRNHSYHSYPKQRGELIGQAIRTERYRMVQWTNVVNENEAHIYELYDYEEDPLETKNFANEKPEVLKELIEIVNTHPKPVILSKNST